MKPADLERIAHLTEGLKRFEKRTPLKGIREAFCRDSFIAQLVESIRRIEYIKAIQSRPISPSRRLPGEMLFDPYRAAVLMKNNCEFDEAFWLIFISVHFGKHLRRKWQVARSIYGAFGGEPYWTWKRTSPDPGAFRKWLSTNESRLKGIGFGNHRKYQSLSATAPSGTGAAFESYVCWIQGNGGHQAFFTDALKQANGDPKRAFDLLYDSMRAVSSFGRMGRFDYLTMIGKLGLANIEPGSTYMDGATGPYIGGCLLFTGAPRNRIPRHDLEERLIELGDALNVGMQVIEDALCNWQKSPHKFKAFRG